MALRVLHGVLITPARLRLIAAYKRRRTGDPSRNDNPRGGVMLSWTSTMQFEEWVRDFPRFLTQGYRTVTTENHDAASDTPAMRPDARTGTKVG